MLPVAGHVRAGRKGTVVLELGLASSSARHADESDHVVTSSQKRPCARMLLNEIRSGAIEVHATKKDVKLRSLQTQLANIQTTLALRTGSNGDWSVQADQRLHAWLQRPRCGTCSSSPSKALEDDKEASQKPSESLATSCSSSRSASPPRKARKASNRKLIQHLRACVGDLEAALGRAQDEEERNAELHMEVARLRGVLRENNLSHLCYP